MRNTKSPFLISDRTRQNTAPHIKQGTQDRVFPAMPKPRHGLLLKMALTMMIGGAVLFPLAILALLQGEVVPLILSFMVMGIGIHSFTSTRRGNYTNVANVELAGIVAGGLLLTIADPMLLDPGLALIFLAPVHLAMIKGKTSGKNIWLTMASLALFAGTCTAGWLPQLLSSGTIVAWTGAGFCSVIISMQLYSAFRLFRFGHDRDRAHNAAVRHLAEQMGDGYVRFSAQGKVLFASKLTQDLLGAERYELAGQGLLERVHILDRPVFLKGFSDSAHSGKSEIIEARLRKDIANSTSAAPNFIWVEVFFSPIVDVEVAKENWEIVALLRDITNRKDHEFELIAAQKAAEEASNTKSGFLATIGHELRTPLNAIVGFSEMMSNGIGGELEPAHAEYAQLIFQSGHHLLDVVNMLLDMSKIDAGKFELQLTKFEASDLVRPCLQMIESSAAEKGVKLRTDLSQNLPVLKGDERACRQILINLLSNAVKFSEAGSEVLVCVRRQGQRLKISVTDTGIGMSTEAAGRVGEAFFQAHDGLTRKYEGTGLGLSIVRGLIELHEGSMNINSELGRGTTINILLPINGPQSRFVEPEIVTPLVQKASDIQPGHWPEQKSIAL